MLNDSMLYFWRWLLYLAFIPYVGVFVCTIASLWETVVCVSLSLPCWIGGAAASSICSGVAGAWCCWESLSPHPCAVGSLIGTVWVLLCCSSAWSCCLNPAGSDVCADLFGVGLCPKVSWLGIIGSCCSCCAGAWPLAAASDAVISLGRDPVASTGVCKISLNDTKRRVWVRS